jgi:hypothetical protein
VGGWVAGEEEEEEEEGLYFPLETRERVQTRRRSPNAVARHRLQPQVDGTTPQPPDACLPAEHCCLVKVTGGPSPPKEEEEEEEECNQNSQASTRHSPLQDR